MNDQRFLWLLMIPQISGASELRDLPQRTRHQLIDTATDIADIVQTKTNADKMNVATIGNIVPQLHLHIIARHIKDATWPNPVWGHGTQLAYDDQTATDKMDMLKDWLSGITS